MAQFVDVDPTKGNFPEVDAFLATLDDLNGALIPTLHHAQETYGYLPKEVQLYIARKLGIPAAKVYGVATFYSLFSMEKRGKYIVNVCMGTACFVRGADKVLQQFEKQLNCPSGTTTTDGMYTVEALRCIGACGLAPVLTVNGKVYGRIGENDVKGVIDDFLAGGTEA